MRFLHWSIATAALAVLATGCALDRAPLVPDATPPGMDGGHSGDAGHTDGQVVVLDAGPDAGAPCIPSLEVCNGIDDDCDPDTPDGAADMIGMSCDSDDDTDLCQDDLFACVDGSLVCPQQDGEPSALDLCDGDTNDDCNPDTPDGADDPRRDVMCDGDDGDSCEHGVTICDAGSIVCGSETSSSAETCNGVDDDCDEVIDEDATDCPSICEYRGRPDDVHGYLFCDSSMDWNEARDFCHAVNPGGGARGYELVTIDDDGEQNWVRNRADRRHNNSSWWIGASYETTTSMFVWVADGSAVAYMHWGSGQPNDLASGFCVDLETDETTNDDDDGGWHDTECDRSHFFICEAAPSP